ncbi:MAG: tetratricopeptide repeat protein, partial [Candidatus Odinarchaeota archaeon]
MKTAQTGVWKEKYENQFTKRIDEARNFLNQGKAKVAKKLYENLLKDISEEKGISPSMQFRVYNNLACCERELGLEKDAITHFELAHSILPEDKKGLANMATAQALRGKSEDGLKYVDQVLKTDSQNIHGICVKANLLIVLKRYDEAIDLFKDSERKEFDKNFLENAQCCYTLGFIYYEKGDYGNAQKFSKKAIDIDSSVSDHYFLLGMSIGFPALQKNSLPWLVPEEIKENLTVAANYLSRAIDILRDSEQDLKIGSSLINRSAIRIALNELEEAIRDCEQLLKRNIYKVMAFRNKGIAEYLSGRFAEAISSWFAAID